MSVGEILRTIEIPLDGLSLTGRLRVPEEAMGIVIFSHGSGSSRLSPRNNFVAEVLHQHKLATLLFDLLTEEEDQVYANRFNINLLTLRLIEVSQWVKEYELTRALPMAFFGASTGAASALKAAAVLHDEIKAVVSRGGRPDLALSELSEVSAPTLLLVGGYDHAVIDMNKEAYDQLQCVKELKVIPGASHLFEEKGKLGEVARESAKWFVKWLTKEKSKKDV